MADVVLYQQINKDHAFFSEKRLRNPGPGGNTAGLLTHLVDGVAVTNVLFDAGLGTTEGLCDLARFDWAWPLDIVLTHAHADHHAELQLLSEQWCTRIGPRRPAIPVRAHRTTLDHVAGAHAKAFGDGRTLEAAPIQPGVATQIGIFRVTGVAVDHVPGAMIYAVEFGREKVVVAWDMRSPPRPDEHPVLLRPSLALVESNTWSAVSDRTGHTSVEELMSSGFLRDLRLPESPGTPNGAFLVHYSGAEDPDGPMSDADLAWRVARAYPNLAPWVRVAARGQLWSFEL